MSVYMKGSTVKTESVGFLAILLCIGAAQVVSAVTDSSEYQSLANVAWWSTLFSLSAILLKQLLTQGRFLFSVICGMSASLLFLARDTPARGEEVLIILWSVVAMCPLLVIEACLVPGECCFLMRRSYRGHALLQIVAYVISMYAAIISLKRISGYEDDIVVTSGVTVVALSIVVTLVLLQYKWRLFQLLWGISVIFALLCMIENLVDWLPWGVINVTILACWLIWLAVSYKCIVDYANSNKSVSRKGAGL